MKTYSLSFLYRRLVLAVTVLYACISLGIVFMLGRVLTPFYQDRLARDMKMETEQRASELISDILENNFSEAYRVVGASQFAPGAQSKALHVYSLDNYKQYGLPFNCRGQLVERADMKVCFEKRALDVEIPLSSADNLLGHLTLRTRADIYAWPPFRGIAIVILGSFLFVAFIGIIAGRRFERTIAGPIQAAVSKVLSTDHPDEIRSQINAIALQELKQLSEAVVTRSLELRKLQFAEELGRLSAQVAHDIRSPLAALDSVIGDVAQLPEEKRILIRSAVSRIHDIANSLIAKNRALQAAAAAPASASAPPTNEMSRELLSSHVAPLITEKRLKFRDMIGVTIEDRLGSGSYGLFADIHPTDFKRVLSNLIDNAVEALGEKGRVRINLASEDGQIALRVRDNGGGIPADLLGQLGRKGATHGKSRGAGLGLYHAKTTIESWGGRLEIESEIGKGTNVTIRLPQAQPPSWFVERLLVAPGRAVAVFDDDSSIHQVWQGRFDAAKAKDHGVDLIHFTRPAELRSWVKADPRQAAALFLMDYELLGHEETGLGLIADLRLGDRAILVTSHFEEKRILAECLRLNVRMIPKGLAGFVPICIEQPAAAAATPMRSGPDAVLVDDDPLVHMTWKIAAKSKGLDLLAFTTRNELLAGLMRVPKDTPVYLDVALGDGTAGDRVAEDLHSRGFSNLYLATGRAPDSFPPMPWIRQIVGKEPPWS